MPLEISRRDILKINADIIVDPSDHFLSGSGSIDKQIHEAAGEEFDRECKRIAYLDTGKALITDSFALKTCKHIIVTCGPVYIDGNHNEEELLASCYREALKLAIEKKEI